MKKILLSLSAALLWSVSSYTLATTITHGVISKTASEIGGSYTDTFDGGSGFVNVTSSNADSSALAISMLSGTLGSPVLRTFVDGSASNAFRDASAQGIQSYQYNGASSTTLTVTGNFHGYMSGDSSYLGGGLALINIPVEDSDFDSGALFPNLGEFLLPSEYDQDHNFVIGVTGEQNFTAMATINLNPGDMFYLLGVLESTTDNGVVDATNTGAFSFSSTAGLTPLGGTVSAVPVPAALYLFAPAILGLFGFKRKQKA